MTYTTVRSFFDPTITSVGRLAMSSLARDDCARSLDGTWQFHLAQNSEVVPENWFANDALPWRPIEVPGVWTRQSTGDLPHYTNIMMPFAGQPPSVPHDNPTGIHRTTFDRPDGERTVVEFGGAESMLALWCNGHFVGMGKDSRLSSTFDLTPHLEDGANTLAALVTRWSDATWIEDQDHWYHGGLHRSVRLITTPRVHIHDVIVDADFDPVDRTGRLRLTVEVGADQLDDGWTVAADLSSVGVPDSQRVGVPADPADLGIESLGAAYGYDGRRAVLSASDLSIEQWNAESPTRYPVTVELIGPDGVHDRVELSVGFRRVEIRDRQLLVNGMFVMINGVNRHDHHAVTGKTLTRDEMRDELTSMKRHSINAVRTAHYPNDPALLDLCDELGMYVIDEANIESHARHDSLLRSGMFDVAVLDRVRRMVLRDRSHPSVVGWSLGNESGHAAAHDAAAAWVRRTDPTRFVQYEGGFNSTWKERGSKELRERAPDRSDRLISDVVCPMYASVEEIVEWAQWAERTDADDRPLILCEYSHAMGNSNGGLDRYWHAFRAERALGGGFVWDWKDQGLLETAADGAQWWAYGGHYGDEPNDGNFCINGLVDPVGLAHPALRELAWLARPVAVDFADGMATIENRHAHSSLDHVRLRWWVEVDGRITDEGDLDLPEVPAGRSVEVALDIGPVMRRAHDAVTLVVQSELAAATPWADAGHVLGHDQFSIANAEPARGAPDPAAASASTVPTELPKLRPTLWRAPTDNDGVAQGWMADFSGVRPRWIEWGLDRLLVIDDDTTTDGPVSTRSARLVPEGKIDGSPEANYRSVITRNDDGSLTVDDELVVPERWTDVPRVGVMFELPGSFERLRWFGPGPDETYPDRRSGSRVSLWETAVDDQYHPYVVPQEHGAHVGCRWFELVDANGAGCRITGDPELIFSARRHTDADLTSAATLAELHRADHIEVHIDAAIRGLGTAACGPDTEHRFVVGPGPYRWRWHISRFGTSGIDAGV